MVIQFVPTQEKDIMKKETKITVAERKFIAQRKLANHGIYNPALLRRNHVTKIESSWLESIGRFISLTMANTPETFVKAGVIFNQLLSQSVAAVQQNLTFVTEMGGKNLLITTQESKGEEILKLCNSTQLNSTAIANMSSLLTKLCDGSMIFCLNNSKLNMTNDASLKCIKDRFDSTCESSFFLTTEQMYLILGGVGVIMAGCCGCYSAYKITQKCQRPKLESFPLLYQEPEPKVKNENHNENNVTVKLCCC